MNYIIQLSNKTNIEIDQDDFEKIKRESATGNFIQVKKGIVNPSFIIAIVPLEKDGVRKIQGHIDEKKGVYVIESDEFATPVLVDDFEFKRLTN